MASEVIKEKINKTVGSIAIVAPLLWGGVVEVIRTPRFDYRDIVSTALGFLGSLVMLGTATFLLRRKSQQSG